MEEVTLNVGIASVLETLSCKLLIHMVYIL
jgi:hypothetical protein